MVTRYTCDECRGPITEYLGMVDVGRYRVEVRRIEPRGDIHLCSPECLFKFLGKERATQRE
jgi:hypothetical protein